MSLTAIQPGPRQQLQDDVLTLIRTRLRPQATGAANSAAAFTAPADPVQRRDAVARINDALKALGTDLSFEVDHGSREVIVKVIDHATGEVLRQIPDEVTLQIAHSLDKLAGHLIDHKI